MFEVTDRAQAKRKSAVEGCAARLATRAAATAVGGVV